MQATEIWESVIKVEALTMWVTYDFQHNDERMPTHKITKTPHKSFKNRPLQNSKDTDFHNKNPKY